jgi:hypothetical protein
MRTIIRLNGQLLLEAKKLAAELGTSLTAILGAGLVAAWVGQKIL